MKKAMMVTTAIVGTSLLAVPAFAGAAPELVVSGYARAELWAGSQDDESDRGDRSPHMETDDSEIRFSANATADNGLKYGAYIELDMDGGGTTDEIHLQFSGDWGTLRLGDQDGAEDAMPYDGTFSLTGQGGYDGGASSFFDFNGVSASSPDMAGDTSDATKITYFTPRFGGFQVGVSYTPDTGHDFSESFDSDGTNNEHHFGLGANYVESFNGVDVGIGGAIVTADGEDARTAEEAEGYHVGFNIGYSGFTFGAGHGDNGDTGVAAGSSADAGEWWEVALGYSMGPWSAHAGYFHGEQDPGGGASDDETDFLTFAINYDIAPGLRAYAEFDHIEVDQAGSGDGIDNEGNIFMVGTNISF